MITDGSGGRVKFTRNGDGLGIYNVYNYRRNRTTNVYEYQSIGNWSADSGLAIAKRTRITWADGTYTPPYSRCSDPCQVGHVMNVQQGDTCCWVCTPCQPWQYVDPSGYICIDCELGTWPTTNRTACYELTALYMDWSSAYSIVPAYLAGIGVVVTIFVIVTFIRNIRTPIVMASGRELSFTLLSGFLICFAMTFVLLAKPSPIICAVQRFGLTFGFAVTYSSLLTKTNRISRIFDSARLSAKRPPCISPRSQVIIAFLLISFQVILNILWLIVEPPETHVTSTAERSELLVLKCRFSNEYFMLSLIYSIFLIGVCTLYAVKTRNIPENFNESKFIGFTMYTTCIIWLAFVPIYFSTSHAFQVRITIYFSIHTFHPSISVLTYFLS